MPEETRKPTKCVRCNFPISSNTRYCPDCQWDQREPYTGKLSSFKEALLILVLGICLWFILWGAYKAYISKEREIAKLEQMQHQTSASEKLSDIPIAMVSSGMNKINDMLSNFREKPKDVKTLNGIADFSFSQGVFARAADFYRQYLALEPEDLEARTKYAASLRGAGNDEGAVQEYRKIISKDPGNFRANTDLARTYIKLNQRKDAKTAIDASLKSARSTREREEVEQLILTLNQDAPNKPEDKASAANQSSSSMPGYDGIINLVWNDSIIGPKLTKSSVTPKDKALILYLQGTSPEQLKSKQTASLASQIQTLVQSANISNLNTILFMDHETNRELARINLIAK